MVTHPFPNEIQISELTSLDFINQFTDFGNREVFTTCSMKAFNFPVDIYNFTMDTLDSTFYSEEGGYVATYSIIRVTAHFSGQVNMPKISSLVSEQRHVFDSNTLYNNEHKDKL